jgi:prenyltransferase beta subunit
MKTVTKDTVQSKNVATVHVFGSMQCCPTQQPGLGKTFVCLMVLLVASQLVAFVQLPEALAAGAGSLPPCASGSWANATS